MKYVLITGGTRGLGKELARYFLKKGYGVIINYVGNDLRAEETKKELQNISSNIYLYKADISQEEDVKELFNKVKELNISLEVVLLNAGIDNTSDMEEKTYETFKRILEVNVLGNFLMTKYFGTYMESKGKGSLIYINSDNIIDQNDYVTLEYDVSKSGLYMMAKDFAKYFRNVKVHSVAPGWLDTEMNKIPEDIKKEIDFVDMNVVCEKVYEEINNKETGNLVVVRK